MVQRCAKVGCAVPQVFLHALVLVVVQISGFFDPIQTELGVMTLRIPRIGLPQTIIGVVASGIAGDGDPFARCHEVAIGKVSVGIRAVA